MTRQSLLIWGGLIITVWLSWNTYQQEQSQLASSAVVMQTRIISQQASQHTSQQALQLQAQQQASTQAIQTSSAQSLQLSARQSVISQIDLFAAPKQMIEEAPAKNLQQALKAPPPTAPPLPFKYLGRIQAGTGVSNGISTGVLLNVNNEVTPIQTGDILLGQYIVQAISETETGVQIQFLYQPLNLVQTLTGLTTN